MNVDYSHEATKDELSQLQKKFQLVHFLTLKNKPLNFYREMVRFEKEVHGVNVGTGYLNE